MAVFAVFLLPLQSFGVLQADTQKININKTVMILGIGK
jgi:hypothetical protein